LAGSSQPREEEEEEKEEEEDEEEEGDDEEASGWYGQLRWPISPSRLSLLSSDQL